jgi:hypothetical protein
VGNTTDGDWVWEGGQPVVTGVFLSKTYLRGCSVIWGPRKAWKQAVGMVLSWLLSHGWDIGSGRRP